MTTITDIANKSLQSIGIQKKISSLAQDSAEAQAIALIATDLRDDLLRMAPWSCALKTANLAYITSAPGTPENTSAATTLWQPGQPTPPWTYEYQYPVDCLRACWLIPANQTGYSGGVPITTAVTGGASSFWQGPPVRFTVQTDTFVPVTAAAVANGGSGYVIGDTITLPQSAQGLPPVGAPAVLNVVSVSGSGAITGVSVRNELPGAATIGGSYFAPQVNPIAQGSTSGLGIGATFNLTFGPAAPQRVILTNQEFATMVYVQQVIDPDVMDTLFQRAWMNLIAAHIAMQLCDPKVATSMANIRIGIVNDAITKARVVDGNEGFAINDVTPDWIRIRGYGEDCLYNGPYNGFDWGMGWPAFG